MMILHSLVYLLAANLFAQYEIPEKREYLVNDKINPCVDFYQYVCSSTISNFKLRPDRNRHAFAFSDSNERILLFEKKYLENLASINPTDDVELSLKKFYNSCVDLKARSIEELQMVESLKKSSKQFGTIKLWAKEQFRKMLTVDASFIVAGVISNLDRPTKSDLAFGTSFKFLPDKSYVQDEKLMEAFFQLAIKFYRELNFDHPDERAKSLVKFEQLAQQFSQTAQERRDSYTKRNFTTKLKILKKLKHLISLSDLKEIGADILLREPNPNFFSFIHEATTQFSIDELKSAEAFYYLSPKLDQAFPDYYKEKFNFNQQFLGGANKRQDISEECTNKLRSVLASEFDFVIIQKMFPNFNKEPIKSIAAQIRSSILLSLEKNSWLSSTAKKEAKRKMETANMRLVSPDTKEDWHLLPLSDLKTDQYLNNVNYIDHLKLKRELSYLKQDRDLKSWEEVSPLSVNAFYEHSNQFTMLQGILQYPFYDSSQSEIENMAGVGSVIGHELY